MYTVITKLFIYFFIHVRAWSQHRLPDRLTDNFTKQSKCNNRLYIYCQWGRFQIYTCSMVTLTNSNFQIHTCSMVTLPNSNFQIYICSKVTLTNSNFQLPNPHMFNGHTSKFQLPNLHMFNGDTDKFQLPTSKSTYVQWWHSDKNSDKTCNFRTFTYFQLPNWHIFNGDTLTKILTKLRLYIDF